MGVNTAANPAMRFPIGMETGVGAVDQYRRHGPTEVGLGVDGSAWAYCFNNTGSSIPAGAVAVTQGTVSGTLTNLVTTGAGYTVDKAVPNTYWYWAREVEGGVGPGSDYTIGITLSAGATNKMHIAVQVKDGQGTAANGVYAIRLYFSDSASGIGLTATAFSGTLVATATKGAVQSALTAAKEFLVVTNANGVFEGDLTDTAKTATVYTVVVNPSNGVPVVSAISGTSWG